MPDRLSSLRVNDPVLTSAAFDYKFPTNAGISLFPIVLHSNTAGKISVFTKESFAIVNGTRALTAKPARVTRNIEKTIDFVLDEISLSIGIDDREYMSATEPLKRKLLIGQAKTISLMNQISLQVEKQSADIMLNPNNYPSTHTLALSGSSCFSNANSDPIGVVENAKEIIRSSIEK